MSVSAVPLRLLVSGVFVAILIAVALVPAIAGELGVRDRVAGGVTSMGRDFGHLKREEVPAAIKAAFAEYSRKPLAVRYGDSTLTVTAVDLGASIDVDVTGESILDAERLDSVGERLSRLVGRDPSRTVPPVLSLDPTHVEAALAPLAKAVDQPARDAQLEISASSVSIRAPRNGVELDPVDTARLLTERLTSNQSADVFAAIKQVSPAVVESDLQRAAENVKRIIAGPVVVRHNQHSWILGTDALIRMLGAIDSREAASRGAVAWDDQALGAFVAGIAREADVKPTEATVETKGGKFTVVAGNDGRQVNIAATIANIEKAAFSVDRQATVAVAIVPPLIPVADLQQATELANEAIASPMRLIFREQQWVIAPADLASAISFTRTQSASTGYSVRFDPEELRPMIERIAGRVDSPAREPRVKLAGDKVVLITEPVDGIKVDVNASLAQVARQAFTDQRTVPLSVAVAKPRILAGDVGKVSFPDLIADSTTSYAGSIPERAHNVELAASRLNGTLIPPDATFSFNSSVGPTTLTAGYQIGYGITMKNGEPVTVPAEAGGICQVATTLFHTAFWAGLPIVQRTNHIYWISRYVSRGLVGLDATVDDPWVDLQFRNTTGAWILVEASTDGANLRFALRGKKPDWEVKVAPPAITAVVKASTETARQEDSTMPAGTELWVEHAEDGFTSQIQRTVQRGSQVLDNLNLVSRYVAARNVLLVGTKGATPTPAPSLTPTAATTPPATGTPVTATAPLTPTATPTVKR